LGESEDLDQRLAVERTPVPQRFFLAVDGSRAARVEHRVRGRHLVARQVYR